MTEQEAARAILYGLALGDALGWPIEFLRMDKISAIYGDVGISEPPDPANYSDETQTSLVVAEALVAAGGKGVEPIMDELSARLVVWGNSDENTRAPGHTVTEAVRNLEAGVVWYEAGAEALGNGSTIRVAPIGYFFQRQPEQLRRVASAAGKVTHTHPTAEIATIAAAYLIKLALDGAPIDQIVNLTLRFVGRQSQQFTETFRSISEKLTWPDEVAALNSFGGGWLAHEAVSMAAFCVLRHPDSFVDAVRLAANIPGDSDSVASITGGLSGAIVGVDGIPSDWIARLENKAILTEAADQLSSRKERVFGSRQ